MKHRAACFALSLALSLSGGAALAQDATYVFPYEGFRYTQREDETVLTQTNLDEHEELLSSLGTTKEAVLASYVASGIVMEVIPDDGGQIAVSVTDAGDFAEAGEMDKLDDAGKAAFLAQFEESGLYETSAYVDTKPVCVRLTSSAMYASMPVYSLRYATLHLGRLYIIEQTIVGRAPSQEDDARMERLLSGVKLLTTASDATPAPTPAPTATPEPTPVPTPGVAEALWSAEGIELDELPAFVMEDELTISGRTERSSEVTVRLGRDKEGSLLGRTTAKKDGRFSVRVKLPEEGDLELLVSAGEDDACVAMHYEKPAAKLVITEPESPVFTGGNVTVRGETEPGATVYITGRGTDTNVKAGKKGGFSIRVFMDEGTADFTLRAKANGFKESTAKITLTRELSEKEQIENFRMKMIALEYDDLKDDPEKYAGRRFIFRGRVMDFTDYNGSPCALVCVGNPATGVWQDPVYVVLEPEDAVSLDEVVNFYLRGEGLTLPAAAQYNASGLEEEVPVARAEHITRTK